jgi:hypothetical protein
LPKWLVALGRLSLPTRLWAEQVGLFQSLPVYIDVLAKKPNTRLPELGMLIDQSYSLEPGTSLARLRALAALRALTFDISIPWTKLVSQDLQVVEDIALLRASYAANQ